MELLLIRHGLPVTVDNRDTGAEADPVLSELGCRQAEALADWFVNPPTAQRIDAVYASPKARAQQTVAPLAAKRQTTAENIHVRMAPPTLTITRAVLLVAPLNNDDD